MDAKEVAEWSAYDRISPLIPERFDRLELLLAQLAALTFNVHRGAKVRARETKDWLPKRVWGTPSEGSGESRQSTDDHIRMLGPLMALAAAQKEAARVKAKKQKAPAKKKAKRKGKNGDSR